MLSELEKDEEHSMTSKQSNRCKHKIVPLERGELYFCTECNQNFKVKTKKEKKRKLKSWVKI